MLLIQRHVLNVLKLITHIAQRQPVISRIEADALLYRFQSPETLHIASGFIGKPVDDKEFNGGFADAALSLIHI